MSITFTDQLDKPSEITTIPNQLLRPIFGASYGFDVPVSGGGGGGFNVTTRDTEANILASTPSNPSGQVNIAFGTDTKDFYIYNGSGWYIYNDTPAFANQYSVSFDGSDDYMIADLDGTASGGVLASSDADINLTISMWLKPLTAASGNGEGIFGWQPALSSAYPMITATTIRIFLDGAFRHSWLPGEMDDFTWNNLIITRTASDNTWRGYVKGNASPVFSHDDGGSITNRANASAIYLANQYFGYGNILIDEVAVWNTNQDSNISTIYNSGVPGDLTSLSPVGWWRMGDNDGASGTTITDQGSGSNNGTLTNGPTFSTTVPS